MTKKIAKAKKNPNELRMQDIPAIQGLKGTTPDYQEAKMTINPAVNASIAIKLFEKKFVDVDMTHLVNALNEEIEKANSRDLTGAGSMLVAQATILDAIFNNLAIRSAANMGEGYLEATETYMKLALRAQSQSRSTWEALSAIQNPIQIVKQQNVARGHQQVNNYAGNGENEFPQAEKLEVINGERVDTRTTSTAVDADSELEAVGKDKGASNRGRKKTVRRK